jgi:hypothetical protein
MTVSRTLCPVLQRRKFYDGPQPNTIASLRNAPFRWLKAAASQRHFLLITYTFYSNNTNFNGIIPVSQKSILYTHLFYILRLQIHKSCSTARPWTTLFGVRSVSSKKGLNIFNNRLLQFLLEKCNL